VNVVTALRDALQEPNPQRSEQRVHEIVAREIDTLAPRTRVRSTGYFNHSWAPDLIVERDDAERGIFLRFDVHEPAFVDDLEYLASESPLFLDISAANPFSSAAPQDDGQRFDVGDAVRSRREAGVMVTEAPAIERLTALVEHDKDLRVATREVVVGGHGFIDTSAVERFAGGWRFATESVAHADAHALREALDQVEEYLAPASSLDLESELRTKWIAAGQPAELFPGREAWVLANRTPRDIARVVMSMIEANETVTEERWRDLTSSVSASAVGHELSKIGRKHVGGVVNDFVRAGLGLWTAQYAYVPPLDAESMERFEWSVGGYSIGINLGSRIAYFSDIGEKWSRVPRTEALPLAAARLPSLRTSDVRGAGLVTVEENIRETLRVSARVSLADRLEQLVTNEQDYAFRAARLETLDIRIPSSDATAHIDFHRSVVRTSKSIPLRAFVMLCARFVAALTLEELTDLEKLLQVE
jgi:hypothetical protein